MNNLQLPNFEIGMIVITPTDKIEYLTEDKKYVIINIKGDRLLIEDDSGERRLYKSHLFIEADVYYNMIMFLTTIRLFNINPNQLK